MLDETAWYRWDERLERWQFSHLEVGWNDGDAPTPRTEGDKRAWAGVKWDKRRMTPSDKELTENFRRITEGEGR